MKNIARSWFIGFAGLGLVFMAISYCGWMVWDMKWNFFGYRLERQLPTLRGESRIAVVEKFGLPRNEWNRDAYVDELDRIDQSFEPDAPEGEFDKVLEFTNGQYLCLVFLRADVVVETYWGTT